MSCEDWCFFAKESLLEFDKFGQNKPLAYRGETLGIGEIYTKYSIHQLVLTNTLLVQMHKQSQVLRDRSEGI